jgi:PPOX class probable F420-dependent enzyme
VSTTAKDPIPAALRALIATGPLAHLVTLNADGSPQVTVVWIGVDGDEIVSAHMDLRQKLRNIQRDPRIAISLEAPRQPATFLAEHAILHGTARVDEGGAGELLQRLGKVYVGPDFEFPAADRPGGYVMRMTVERVIGVGPWASP